MSFKCTVCKKSAYANESMSYDKKIFHTTCFKCLECRGTLQISNVAMFSGAVYCKNCFVKLFKLRGRYSVFTHDKDDVVEVEVEGDDPRAGLPAVSEEDLLSDKKSPTPITVPTSPTASSASSTYTPKSTTTEPYTPKSTLTEPSTPKDPKAPLSPTETPKSEAKAVSPASTATKSTTFFGPRCKKCEKSAYPEESTKYDGVLYHTACFKCLQCKSSLTVRNVAQFQGDIYCKNCFVRMFKTQGNYNAFKKDGSTTSPMEPASPTSAS